MYRLRTFNKALHSLPVPPPAGFKRQGRVSGHHKTHALSQASSPAVTDPRTPASLRPQRYLASQTLGRRFFPTSSLLPADQKCAARAILRKKKEKRTWEGLF
ncbi:hypothetical protein E2C01_066468 [Portunus trituberculatus]|uniref:Uncharacterized protein n=1 Tax=Portunus trituberculatus TaxID=210409 RepID=A0A5B7HUR6_PORTR|nr:hypothetical protein [Portunus trituberculatus]